ncbi:MAG TPA: hypothetical protein O0Y06_08025 [Methanocorpusculum sp.]|nr:hypothetical protein [Methanocorpusculum sp.]HJK80832.1 hypothetical protein [Methanocorpusculum sp.]
MTKAAGTTTPQPQETILSRLSPRLRRMADRDLFVRAMFTPEFVRFSKEILAEEGN